MQDDHTTPPHPREADLETYRQQVWDRAQATKERVQANNARSIRRVRNTLKRLQDTADQQRAARQDMPTDGGPPPA